MDKENMVAVRPFDRKMAEGLANEPFALVIPLN